MKFGPTLNGANFRPRLFRHSMRPMVTVVLPEPLTGAAMMIDFIIPRFWHLQSVECCRIRLVELFLLFQAHSLQPINSLRSDNIGCLTLHFTRNSDETAPMTHSGNIQL